MTGDPALGAALQFLDRLKKNNNKQWFEQNKGQYEQAMEQFELLVGRLLAGLGKVVDLQGLSPKDCIMRIYRDVRFSKDKSPYKTGLGAGIVPGGRKSGRPGFHLHLAPNGTTMTAGGLWEPAAEQLSRFRQAISHDAAPFKKILASGRFKRHFGELTGDKLKAAPQGYPAAHPEIELLRYKQVCVMERFADEAVASPGFPALVLESLKAMQPFVDYLDQVVRG